MRLTLSSFLAVLLAFACLVTGKPSRTIPAKLRRGAIINARAPSPEPLPSTNAQRLSLGLPPLKPRRRWHSGLKRDSTPSGVPVPDSYRILVTDTGTNTVLGYLSPTLNEFGEYGIVQPNTDGALQISFTYNPSSPRQIDITTVNGVNNAAFPFFGGVYENDDNSFNIGVGSTNRVFLGNMASRTSPGQSASVISNEVVSGDYSHAESAIWIFDPNTHELTAQWINKDGSAPGTHLVFFNAPPDTDPFGDTEIYSFFNLVGDPALYLAGLGSWGLNVKFTLV